MRKIDRERKFITKTLQERIASGQCASVLDVGCGYGRNLKEVSRLGVEVVGVDVNPDAVAHNWSLGLKCYTPDRHEWERQYDAILMSHIIEHFSPNELVDFLETYLAYLKPGGCLIIATPLLTDYFYCDFTHIKPYLPESILMVFGGRETQISRRSRTVIELKDLWFRTSAYKIRWTRMRYLRGFRRMLLMGLNGVLSVLHSVSLGVLGRKDGWVGVFSKES